MGRFFLFFSWELLKLDGSRLVYSTLFWQLTLNQNRKYDSHYVFSCDCDNINFNFKLCFCDKCILLGGIIIYLSKLGFLTQPCPVKLTVTVIVIFALLLLTFSLFNSIHSQYTPSLPLTLPLSYPHSLSSHPWPLPLPSPSSSHTDLSLTLPLTRKLLQLCLRIQHSIKHKYPSKIVESRLTRCCAVWSEPDAPEKRIFFFEIDHFYLYFYILRASIRISKKLNMFCAYKWRKT